MRAIDDRAVTVPATGSWRTRLGAPVDVAGLVWLRIVVAGAVLAEVVRYARNGWIGAFFVRPDFHFTYWGFDWVRPWPGVGMYVHFVVLAVLATLVLVGLWYRIAAALLFVAFAYVFLLDEALYLNHWYLLCLLTVLLVVVPAHRGFSVDAWRDPRLRTRVAPAWALWLLRVQVALVYLYAGLAKLNADWLAGAPLGDWLARHRELALVGPWLGEPWVGRAAAWGSLALDVALAPLLLWPRTAGIAVAAACGFHLLNRRLFGLGVFPWLMTGATLVFLPPDWPRRLVRRRRMVTGIPEALPSRAVVSGVAVYLVLQALLPLRHVLYPGDASWTEEGHRFAWHMMLREKLGQASFWLVDPGTAVARRVDVARRLTPRQQMEMATHPDMILQVAHAIAADAGRASSASPTVHALVCASLNGRRPQWLVDPAVDLGAEQRSLVRAPWIVPLGTRVDLPEWARTGAAANVAARCTATSGVGELDDDRRSRLRVPNRASRGA